MTEQEREFVEQLTATIDRARELIEDARAAGLEWDQLDYALGDVDLCETHGDLLCRACLDEWGRQTCHHSDHGDGCVLDEIGAYR